MSGTAGADTQRFLARLAAHAAEVGLFDDAAQVLIARAPGRLDVMGGIADYSGSLVLQMPLAAATHAAIAPRDDGRIRVASLVADGTHRTAALDLDAFVHAADDSPLECRRLFADLGAPWLGYVLGPLAIAIDAAHVRIERGFDLLLASDVPEGAGVSSSAAVEVACGMATLARYGVTLDPIELALACQAAENRVVGAACGAMDQVTAAAGEADRLLRLLCQPAEVEGQVPIPPGFVFAGIDSGVRHAVSGDPYTDVRTGAFMGFRMLAEHDHVGAWTDGDHAAFVHPRWGTYLANVTPSEYAAVDDLLPERMLGSSFLVNFGGTSDTVTHVVPEREYPVRAATAHPVHENHRVRAFAALLPHVAEPGVATLLGELMFQSHASYSACGLGSAATDALVAAVRARGPDAGVFGAKITGGGSGGTVAVLAHADALDVVHAIAAEHAATTGHGGRVFVGSSAGAARTGIAAVELTRGQR